jgi:hypothetical protein
VFTLCFRILPKAACCLLLSFCRSEEFMNAHAESVDDRVDTPAPAVASLLQLARPASQPARPSYTSKDNIIHKPTSPNRQLIRPHQTLSNLCS